jgi:hypothetical protein
LGRIIKTDQLAIATNLAERIATFNISEVADLLLESGEYFIQDEKDEIVQTNKVNFINWLSDCIDEFLFVNEDRNKLNYIIDQCIHCRIRNPVIIFENGRFLVFTRDPRQREKCGLMLEFDEDKVSGITFWFLFQRRIILICLKSYTRGSKVMFKFKDYVVGRNPRPPPQNVFI